MEADEERGVQPLDDGEDGGEPLPGETGGLSAHEHCTAGVGEEHRLLGADHCASQRTRRGHFVLCLPSLPPEDNGSKKKRQCNWWCAAWGGLYNWKDPNRVLVIQDGTDASEAKVFRAHAPSQGAFHNLVCSLKLLANTQAGSDNLLDTIFESLPEQSRLNITNTLREVQRSGQPGGGTRSAIWRGTRK